MSDNYKIPSLASIADLPTYYAGMMLCDGRTIIILPNGRVCPQAAFPATTADKVGNRLVTLAYYKGFVYACGGKGDNRFLSDYCQVG